MYDYEWDVETGGYILTTRTGRFVASEIRPVFAEELLLVGLDRFFNFNRLETRPYMWAIKNAYYYHGEKIAQCNGTKYGRPMDITFLGDDNQNIEIEPIDIDGMVRKNAIILEALVGDTKRRVKELYDSGLSRCDKVYIAFSGGKDSVALLDVCDGVLPLDVPVVFSDTDMELPDTYVTWEKIKELYPHRSFIMARAEGKAEDNWRIFGPPSRTIRWCCSIHKSTPALIRLKELVGKSAIRVMAFVGVRGEESISRSFYEDENEGIKNASQMNRMPLLDWGAHELWLYMFRNNLYINRAYRLGLPRVGCIMCPESSEKYVWLVNEAYPGLIQKYKKIILESTNKMFRDEQEQDEFIANQGWQARKSGVVLREFITAPLENIDGLKATFCSPYFSKLLFKTWIRTLGKIAIDENSGETSLVLPHTIDSGIPFLYKDSFSGGELTMNFRSEDEKNNLVPLIRAILRKVSACVGCRACEAECSHGALFYKDGMMQVDEDRCVHCKRCITNIDNNCWRYKSMYKSENELKNPMNSINRYNNFGLREKDSNLWVSILVEMKDSFFPWNSSHPLGKKMVEAASAWFQQSELVDNKTRKPTRLIKLFEQNGGDSELGWEFIWMALANNAVLIKWFITSTTVGEYYNIDRLSDMLKTDYSGLGDSTIKGGLSAFKDMISKSPIGDSCGIVEYEMKGKSVSSVRRVAKTPHPLTVLYGLYLAARLSNNGTFTVSGLMDGDVDSTYISPIVAFGVSGGDFKRICEGLRSRYPDFIATTFTHGNDEVRVFPEKFTTIDVIELAMQEA